MFVIDLERRICIARGSNVDVLRKFADRKSASSYTGNLNNVIGALKVDELTDLYNNNCGDLELPPREKKFAKKDDAKKALRNVLTNANVAEPKNGDRVPARIQLHSSFYTPTQENLTPSRLTMLKNAPAINPLTTAYRRT